MPVVTIVVEALAAFCNGQKVIVAPGSSNIEEICPSFSGPNPFAVNTFYFLFVVLVRHSYKFMLRVH